MERVVFEKHLLWAMRDDDLVNAEDLEKAAVSRDVVRRMDMIKVVARTFIVVETDLSANPRGTAEDYVCDARVIDG
jgi:hypothetical protein